MRDLNEILLARVAELSLHVHTTQEGNAPSIHQHTTQEGDPALFLHEHTRENNGEGSNAPPSAPSTLRLQDIMGVPGLGARMLLHVPLLDRVRLRGLSRVFRSSVDDSLRQSLERLCATELAGLGGDPPRTKGLCWLLSRCPNLRSFSAQYRGGRDPCGDRERNALGAEWEANNRRGEVPSAEREGEFGSEGVGNGSGSACPSGQYTAQSRWCAPCARDMSSATSSSYYSTANRISSGYPYTTYEYIVDERAWATSTRMTAVNDDVVRVLAACCPRLARLDLWRCDQVTDESLLAFADAGINGGACRGVSMPQGCVTGAWAMGERVVHDGLVERRVMDETVMGESVIEGSVMLDRFTDRQVTAEGLAHPQARRAVTHRHLCRASVQAPAARALAHLDVAWCPGVSNTSIIAIAGACRGLKHLVVSWCPRVGDAGVLAVARNCRHLRHLGATGCELVTDESIMAVGGNCPQLEYLDVTGCRELTSAAITAVARGCPGLTYLGVACCQRISDDAIKSVACHCPWLEVLNVGYCSVVSDASIILAAARCPRLGRLDVVDCEMVTDAGIQAVAGGCSQLKYLNITGCGRVTDDGVMAVAGKCPALHTLMIGRCPKVTDAGMLAVAGACAALRCLYVAKGTGVSRVGVRAVAKGCGQMERLHVDPSLLGPS